MTSRICAFALIGLFLMATPNLAWLRDANISDSSDSIGGGWEEGLYLTAEKLLDDKTSIGVYYMPTIRFYSYPINAFQATYNKQVYGSKDEGFAFSYFVGLSYIEYGSNALIVKPNLIPDIGMAFRWKIDNVSKIKLHTFYILPLYLEYSVKISKNIETAASIGYPFQLLSIRYLL